MTTEDYLKKMRELGIDRGALERNMDPINASIVCANKVRERIKYDPAKRGKKMARPPAEDLSHLNSETWKKHHPQT
jgi:hypothetical protein